MGIFDKFKKTVSEKVSSAVEKTSDALKFDKLKSGLEKTRKSISNKIISALKGRKIDQELLDEIEEILITSDIGVITSEKIIDNLKERVNKEDIQESEKLYSLLKEEIHKLIVESPSAENDKIYEFEGEKPYSILVIGVNGAGKTTSIGKLAFNYKKNDKEVIIGAADTFRAAANEQLEVWAQRADVDIIQKTQGSDPASVAFETMQIAKNENKDVVIIDTAGRLHNKANLMQELEKMSRVMKKHKDTAPDEVFLVLDGTTGQNALQQAKEFSKVANITGIILTKLDGTAKGGVVIAIADQLKIPVRYIGVGEQINDLQVFDPVSFVEAMFGTDETDEESSEG